MKQAPDTSWLDRIEIVGGHPAVDFVNTLHSYTEDEPRDYLESGGHVIGWHLHQGLIDAPQARQLASLSAPRHDKLLAESRALRTTLHAVFDGYLKHRPATAALARLNRELERLARWRTLEPSQGGFVWRYKITPTHPHSLFAPLVFAAVELLRSDDLARLKACPPPEGCGWLFLDRSRNGSRNWCNMKTCGNLAKQHRHRARQSKQHGSSNTVNGIIQVDA